MMPRYLIGQSTIGVGPMYVELLRQYGISTVAEYENVEVGPACRGDIWLIDPRVLLDDEKVAIIHEVLGQDALPARIDAACEAAREWSASQQERVGDW